MRPVVITAVLLLVVLMFISDSAAGDPAEMCKTKYQPVPCKNKKIGEGWVQMDNKRCVKAFFNTLSFDRAEEACGKYPNGRLVAIRNDHDQSQVQCAMYRANAGKANYWIGALLYAKACGKYPNGGLVAIRNDDDQSQVQCAMYSANAGKANNWTGARLYAIDIAKNAWIWTDGSRFDYTKWAPGQPNNYMDREFCIEMISWDGLWNDASCTNKKPYVCQVLV